MAVIKDSEGVAPTPIPRIARDVLSYDPETGDITWIDVKAHKLSNGDLAGWVENGRRRIEIEGRAYLAHRVAYFLHTGKQPPRFLDHKDGDPSNNRFDNLRPATRRDNNRNRRVHSNNSTGFRGVILCRESGKYRARAGLNGKKVSIGRYDTPEQASKAYEEFTKKHFGEFYRKG